MRYIYFFNKLFNFICFNYISGKSGEVNFINYICGMYGVPSSLCMRVRAIAHGFHCNLRDYSCTI